jgi:hypothetical protein
MSEIGDPAWFYSSLAQVSASIFGIIGAVFATRIADYAGRTNDSFDSIQRGLDDSHTNLRAHADIITNERSYDSSVQEADRLALTAAAGIYRQLKGPVDRARLRRLAEEVTALQLRLTSPWALQYLRQHAGWLNNHERELRTFRSMAFPGSLWAMWGLLAWLAVVGIIWPMLAPPGLAGTWYLSKRLILGLFSAGAVAFIIFLLRELVLLWRLTTRFEWR